MPATQRRPILGHNTRELYSRDIALGDPPQFWFGVRPGFKGLREKIASHMSAVITMGSCSYPTIVEFVQRHCSPTK